MLAQKPSIRAPKAPASRCVIARGSAVSQASMVPDMNKRNIMNALLVGAAGLPVVGMAVPFLAYFVPPGAGSDTGGLVARDAGGNDIKAGPYLQKHLPGDYSLAQGLKGDPTYLIVNENSQIEKFGLNAVCTHLGCVVPWVPAENKFKCPCHGSQYNPEGKVIRGPAPLSLALAHVEVADDVVTFVPWTEKDFRTDLDPWWA